MNKDYHETANSKKLPPQAMEQFHYFYGSCLVGRTKTKDGLPLNWITHLSSQAI